MGSKKPHFPSKWILLNPASICGGFCTFRPPRHQLLFFPCFRALCSILGEDAVMTSSSGVFVKTFSYIWKWILRNPDDDLISASVFTHNIARAVFTCTTLVVRGVRLNREKHRSHVMIAHQMSLFFPLVSLTNFGVLRGNARWRERVGGCLLIGAAGRRSGSSGYARGASVYGAFFSRGRVCAFLWKECEETFLWFRKDALRTVIRFVALLGCPRNMQLSTYDSASDVISNHLRFPWNPPHREGPPARGTVCCAPPPPTTGPITSYFVLVFWMLLKLNTSFPITKGEMRSARVFGGILSKCWNAYFAQQIDKMCVFHKPHNFKNPDCA
jgi:hypothetical protein